MKTSDLGQQSSDAARCVSGAGRSAGEYQRFSATVGDTAWGVMGVGQALVRHWCTSGTPAAFKRFSRVSWGKPMVRRWTAAPAVLTFSTLPINSLFVFSVA